MLQDRTIPRVTRLGVLIVAVAGVAGWASRPAGALEAGFYLEAAAEAAFGQAAYDLSAPVGSDTVMSRLEVPLDRVFASLAAGCSLRSAGQETWGFRLGEPSVSRTRAG